MAYVSIFVQKNVWMKPQLIKGTGLQAKNQVLHACDHERACDHEKRPITEEYIEMQTHLNFQV